MKKVLIGSVLAALAMFVWGFVFWGAGLGDPFNHMDPDSETAVVAALRAQLPGTGAYQLPDYTAMDEAEFTRRHQAGPIVTIFYQAAGSEPMAPTVFALGYIHYLATALVLAVILKTVGHGLAGYGDRLKLIVLIGLAGMIFANLGNPVWFRHGWGYHIWLAGYDFVSYVVAGLVLAYFVAGDQDTVAT